MKTLFPFAALILLGSCTESRSPQDPYVDIVAPEGYALVWHDEFDAPTADGRSAKPDAERWWYETGASGWGNNELQHYVAGYVGSTAIAEVSDGTLKITAREIGGKVYSIRMNSREAWTYGWFEARLKLPAGRGGWPAFWMMPKNFRAWPDDGEIDIMEEVGYDPDNIHFSVHTRTLNHIMGTQPTAVRRVDGAEGEFHTYAAEWTPEAICGYVDGVKYFEFRNDGTGNRDTWPFDAPFYLKLNLAWGGNWGGAQGIDPAALPLVYEVDYVRVFQKKE